MRRFKSKRVKENYPFFSFFFKILMTKAGCWHLSPKFHYSSTLIQSRVDLMDLSKTPRNKN